MQSLRIRAGPKRPALFAAPTSLVTIARSMPIVPQHVRDAIVADCDARAGTRSEIARRHGVSTAFIRRLLQRRREEGSYAPRPHAGGREPALKGKALARLRKLLREQPDATIDELCTSFPVSRATVCRTLARIGWTVKRGRYRQSKRDLFRTDVTRPVFTTALGKLYEADALDILPRLAAATVDMVFLDPPFNLGKRYGRKAHDRRHNYLDWCHQWLTQCVRVMKPGAALFLFHVPRTAMELGSYLTGHGMVLQNWVAIDFNLGAGTPGRLTPRHYGLLYFTKGKPRTFNTIRVPIQTCRHCGGDVKDYGGHRHEVHRDGVRLSDVWGDVSAVRHAKHRRREANHLPAKLVQRCIELATRTGDVVLDPFAGAGTVPSVCEQTGRRWIAVEIESVAGIVQRMTGETQGQPG
jgi:site-specific DNA-methyltransferase (adenine-specific)